VCDEQVIVTQRTVDIKTVALDNAYKALASHILFLQDQNGLHTSLLSHSHPDTYNVDIAPNPLLGYAAQGNSTACCVV